MPGRRQRADEPIGFLLGADPDEDLIALGVLALESNENVLVDLQQFLQALDGDGPVFIVDVIDGRLDLLAAALFVLGRWMPSLRKPSGSCRRPPSAGGVAGPAAWRRAASGLFLWTLTWRVPWIQPDRGDGHDQRQQDDGGSACIPRHWRDSPCFLLVASTAGMPWESVPSGFSHSLPSDGKRNPFS